jgi:hypothetical protein
MMTSMRTIIDLPPAQLDELAGWCAREGVSRAEAIRRAVAAYLSAARVAVAPTAFGLWRDRAVDGLAYEQTLRQEWGTTLTTRPRRPSSRRARR